MLRSYAYAAAAAVRQIGEIQPATMPMLQQRGEDWLRQVTAAFWDGYQGAAAGMRSLPAASAVTNALLKFFMLEKAIYEVEYELAHRPAWITVPLSGVLAMIDHDGVDNGPA
jgi:maltose alpha-D-glucosyltransferase/alpha-amylase